MIRLTKEKVKEIMELPRPGYSAIPRMIVDLDGTLCNTWSRLWEAEYAQHMAEGPDDTVYYDPKAGKKAWWEQWEGKEKNIMRDTPSWVADVVRAFHSRGGKVIIFSGRKDTLKGVTKKWLELHNIPYDVLKMRSVKNDVKPDGGFMKDYDVKRRMWSELSREDKRNLVHVIDDNPQVVQMWCEILAEEDECDFEFTARPFNWTPKSVHDTLSFGDSNYSLWGELPL
jgi:hypothetical protein